MTNQQGAPDALTDFERRHAIRQGYEIAASDGYFEARPQIDSNDRRKVFQAGFERGWDRHAALVEAQQPATHVQQSAEIEHVAGDVSKNRAEVNMNAYAELPPSVGEYKYGGGLYTDAQMRVFADATHALRTQQPAPATQQAPQQKAQEPCPTCAALARTVMLDQVSFDRKPDCYGIRQITDDEGVEEWEDIRTSPDVAREEANDMMATGRGEIYEVVPLWTTPQHSPTAQADSQPAPVEELDDDACRCEPSDYVRPADYDGDGSVAAMARRAARAPADSVLEDAARYRWLAASCRSTSEHWGGRWSIIIDGPAPKSHDSEDDFDAAVDAARKQGGAT